MKRSPRLPVMIGCALALYAFSYALYWGAAWMVGSPHGFVNLWAKALLPVAVLGAAYYFNQTNGRRSK